MRHLTMPEQPSTARLARQTVSSTPQQGAMLDATMWILVCLSEVSGCLLLGLLPCSDPSPRHIICSHEAALTLCQSLSLHLTYQVSAMGSHCTSPQHVAICRRPA